MTADTIDRAHELRTIITRVVRESTGMHERLALPIAQAVTVELQRRYGGQPLDVPAPSKDDRNQAIIDAWNLGTPVKDLGSKFGASRSTIYRVIGRRAG
ncbi:Mor transcription activator family protein [Thiorhodococcus fuscus]|uniref:Mor transcription activator family protein n=1 Tax=Thiorhodococcus fuscus TaxID=527200 RepID=A0ABW4Y7A2_9GAMM